MTFFRKHLHGHSRWWVVGTLMLLLSASAFADKTTLNAEVIAK